MQDLIDRLGLTWIDGLKTASGNDLASEDHPQHWHADIQEYIKLHGRRKVEADALVILPADARALMRSAILKYLDEEGIEDFEARRNELRTEMRQRIAERIGTASST